MATNQLSGRILIISPAVTLTTKSNTSFTKRELILDCTRIDGLTGERGYENTPSIDFIGAKCAMLDGFKPGDLVTVSFDITGQKITDEVTKKTRYFNSIRGYRIELYQRVPQPQPSAPQPIAHDTVSQHTASASQMSQHTVNFFD